MFVRLSPRHLQPHKPLLRSRDGHRITRGEVGGGVRVDVGGEPGDEVIAGFRGPGDVGGGGVFGGGELEDAGGGGDGDGVEVEGFGGECEGVFDEVWQGVVIRVGGFGADGGVGEFPGVEVGEAPFVERFVLEGDEGVLGGIADEREIRGDGDGEGAVALGEGVGDGGDGEGGGG